LLVVLGLLLLVVLLVHQQAGVVLGSQLGRRRGPGQQVVQQGVLAGAGVVQLQQQLARPLMD
jgi:hypothetical protein